MKKSILRVGTRKTVDKEECTSSKTTYDEFYLNLRRSRTSRCPVAKIPRSQCRGPRFDQWSRNSTPYTAN